MHPTINRRGFRAAGPAGSIQGRPWLRQPPEWPRGLQLAADPEGLLEVLVRGAVIHPRQRLTLARGALASGGQAAALLAVERHVGGQGIEQLLDQPDVPLDDHVDAHLLGEREVLPNLAEERLRRAGKITAVADQPLNGAFACFENRLPGRERPLRAPG